MKTYNEFMTEAKSRKSRYGINQKLAPFGPTISQTGKPFKLDHESVAGYMIRKGFNSATITTKNVEKTNYWKKVSTTDFDKILDAMEKIEK